MDREDKYSYWLDIAEYDMDSAEAMLHTGRYAYVTFMCQQSLEKLAKGLYNYYIDDNVPKVHNISFIITKVLGILRIDEDEVESKFRLFDKLAAYYLQGRYPSFKEKISQLVNEEQAKKMLNESKEAFAWLKCLKK